MECGGKGAENGFQSRPFLPPFHRYIASCGNLCQHHDVPSIYILGQSWCIVEETTFPIQPSLHLLSTLFV
jgi:hypothetical protein